MNIHKQRVEALRELMKKNKFDAFIVLSADSHLSEYLPEHFKTRVFMSGFKGSVGTLLISQKDAFLFVDGRYFLQAQKELNGSTISLQKQDFLSFMKENFNNTHKIGTDFSVLSYELYKNLKEFVNLSDKDLVSKLWQDRPALPDAEIYEHENKYCFNTRDKKLELIREKMLSLNAQAHLISSLDDIAWITNLRGSDVSFNPVFLSHLLILKNEALLFVNESKIPNKLKAKLEKDGFCLCAYESLQKHLKTLKNTTLLLESTKIATSFVLNLDKSVKLIEQINPSTFLKSCKSPKEIKFIQDAMIEDGVALCKFFAWLEEAIKNEKISELDIDTKLTEFRKQSPLYISNSFATIAGFDKNAALPHYRASKESFSYLKKDGLLLLDSGAQYQNGTTDITRVVPLGKVNKEQILDYTLVLKANIAMSSLIFPKNVPMPLLDSVARTPLWALGLDYMHGTGHGVGYFLNVHEGPQVLSYFAPVLEKTRAKEGMITSIEPGLYRAGKWGIRLENLVANANVKKSEFGEFLGFKILTLCPFEPNFIDLSLLDEKEKTWLKTYNKEVFEKLAPNLKDKKALAWLEKRTINFKIS